MTTPTTNEAASSVRRNWIISISALMVALVVMPGIAAIGDIEEGTLADVLFVVQVVVVVVAVVASALALRIRRRASKTNEVLPR
jgi:membrane protein DedA with SNARE-associated domain